MSRTEHQSSYVAKKFVSNVVKELFSHDLEWKQKMWSKVFDVPRLQVLLLEGYGFIT